MDGGSASALPVDLDQVRAAAVRIQEHVHRTPIATSRQLDERTGASVGLKCENLQRVGAFKMRGATNAISCLDAQARRRGVVTHSSGNHAQAVALAGRRLGVPATIVVPEGAPRVKLEATRGYGARIVRCRATQEDREATAARIVGETGGTLIHPYDDATIIAGQGTAALELLEDGGDVDLLLAPVGGGGLLSGTAVAATSRPGVRVVGCEPEGADDARRSLESGRRVTTQTPDTICDGLRTVLGALPFEILRALDVEIVTVTDDEVRAAMLFLMERMKLVVEPSGAVTVAALMTGKVAAKGKRVGAILSGGNVDLRDWALGLGRGG